MAAHGSIFRPYLDVRPFESFGRNPGSMIGSYGPGLPLSAEERPMLNIVMVTPVPTKLANANSREQLRSAFFSYGSLLRNTMKARR